MGSVYHGIGTFQDMAVKQPQPPGGETHPAACRALAIATAATSVGGNCQCVHQSPSPMNSSASRPACAFSSLASAARYRPVVCRLLWPSRP